MSFFFKKNYDRAMRHRNYSLKYLLIFLLAATLGTSCRKESTEPGYTYFVSRELAMSYTREYILSLLDAASADYPEVNEIKGSVAGSVDVYKLIYRTTAGGNEILASGLVCVPSIANAYPVLCFQNGTNTQNAYSPSEFVINTGYQMIEFIASMGYVVVIPDYPGFGESADIPHPYLIKEPTVKSIADMLLAVKELRNNELPGISLSGDCYFLGYSQGGWATLAMHKAMELEYSGDFNLRGSACGAGPYDLGLLLERMTAQETYPMPVYIGYIVNAYTEYKQFSNPVTDILNDPYASLLPDLYTGALSFEQINAQLTTSVAELLSADFLSGFDSGQKYASVREAFSRNSISAWRTEKPLYLLHGGNDTQVDPVTTEEMYNDMMQEGTSPLLCIREIVPGVDHSDGVLPCMLRGLLFIMALNSN